MCDIKTKIFQDLTNYYSNSVKYFDIDTLPIEIDYNDILQLKSNVCYSNKQLVLSINFLGVSNNGIICYTGKESKKKLVSVVISTHSYCYFTTEITIVVL